MKGQMGLMEYIILTFFIAVVIVVLLFFLLGFQVTQLSLEERGVVIENALSLTEQVSNSQLFTKEAGIFDDAKLTALTTIGDACPRLQSFFLGEWTFEVTVLDNSGITTACSFSTYPDCNYWSFCEKPNENVVAFDIPVNVYRNIAATSATGVLPRVDLAVLKVGIYV